MSQKCGEDLLFLCIRDDKGVCHWIKCQHDILLFIITKFQFFKNCIVYKDLGQNIQIIMHFKQKYQFYINYMSNLSRNCKCNIIIIAYFQSSASKMKNKLNTFPVYLNDYNNFLLYYHLTRKYCRSKMLYPLQYGIGLLILIISFLRRSCYIHVQKKSFRKIFQNLDVGGWGWRTLLS